VWAVTALAMRAGRGLFRFIINLRCALFNLFRRLWATFLLVFFVALPAFFAAPTVDFPASFTSCPASLMSCFAVWALACYREKHRQRERDEVLGHAGDVACFAAACDRAMTPVAIFGVQGQFGPARAVGGKWRTKTNGDLGRSWILAVSQLFERKRRT